MAQQTITMYESLYCGYCRAARSLFEDKGLEYTSLVVDNEAELRAEMEKKAGRTSVPQIYVGDHHVGGYDDLAALERKGELDALVNPA